MDALDPNGPARNFTTSGSAKLGPAGRPDRRWRRQHGLVYTPDPHPEAGHFFRSDHFPFAKRGVPALSFGSGNDLVDGGVAAGEAAGKDYTANRYHQPADEWQADWTFAGMAHDLQRALQRRHRSRQLRSLAELVQGFGVPRQPRRHGGGTQITSPELCRMAPSACRGSH